MLLCYVLKEKIYSDYLLYIVNNILYFSNYMLCFKIMWYSQAPHNAALRTRVIRLILKRGLLSFISPPIDFIENVS